MTYDVAADVRLDARLKEILARIRWSPRAMSIIARQDPG
jgi:hypothetical protein